MILFGAWASPPVLGAAAVVAVLATGVLFRVGLASGGLATADYLIRSRAGSGDRIPSRRIRLAGRWQGVGVATLAVIAAVAGGRLATLGPATDQLVAASVGLCLLARAQLVAQRWARSISISSGLVLLGLAGWRILSALPSGGLWLAPIGVAAVAALLIPAGGGRVWPSRTPRMRLLIWMEATAVMAMVCASAVAVGLPAAIRELIGLAPRTSR